MNYEDYAGSRLEVELYRSIKVRIDEVSSTLSAGSVKNYEEYKYWVGYIAALKNMNDMIVTARKAANR
jgi:hypothetical protein